MSSQCVWLVAFFQYLLYLMYNGVVLLLEQCFLEQCLLEQCFLKYRF